MEDLEARHPEDEGAMRTVKDLTAGAVGGIAQVLIGKIGLKYMFNLKNSSNISSICFIYMFLCCVVPHSFAGCVTHIYDSYRTCPRYDSESECIKLDIYTNI